MVADSLIIESENVADGFIVMGAESTSVIDLISTFWKLLTFQVTMPIMANVLLIYPAVIILIFMAIDILKDLVLFT